MLLVPDVAIVKQTALIDPALDCSHINKLIQAQLGPAHVGRNDQLSPDQTIQYLKLDKLSL